MGPRLVPDGRAGVPRARARLPVAGMYQGAGRRALSAVMPPTELCVIHPGALSAACWARLASHLPSGHAGEGARARDDQRFWADDPDLTVDALAERLRGAARPARRARARRLGRRRRRRRRAGRAAGRPGAARRRARRARARARSPPSPTRRGCCARSRCTSARAAAARSTVDPARLSEGLEPALAHILDVAVAAGVAARGHVDRHRRSAATRSTPRASCATTG